MSKKNKKVLSKKKGKKLLKKVRTILVPDFKTNAKDDMFFGGPLNFPLLTKPHASPTMFQLVKEFHEKFNLKYDGGPRELDSEELEYRIGLHKEELQEFIDATVELDTLLANGTYVNSLEVLAARQNVFNELVDNIYVALGSLYRMGYPADLGFGRVHGVNMKKVLPKKGEKTRRDWHGEMVKPDGWEPAVLVDLVATQEWPTLNSAEVKGLITLDGPDCSGKTTLANKFVSAYGAEYIHLTWSPELEAVMDKYRISAIEYAIALSQTKLVVLDRPWISQVVYAEIYRGGTNWPDLAVKCDRLLQNASALQILCIPENVQEGLDAFAGSEKSEVELYSNDIDKTINAFLGVWSGDFDLFKPESSKYLTGIMFSGGVGERSDFLAYTMSRHGTKEKFNDFCVKAISNLEILQGEK